MALIAPQSANNAGSTITFVSAAASDTFANTGNERIIIKTAGTATSVVFTAAGTCGFGLANNAAHNLTVAVGTTAEVWVGPLVTDRFNDGSGLVTITCTPTTAVTLAVVRK